MQSKPNKPCASTRCGHLIKCSKRAENYWKPEWKICCCCHLNFHEVMRKREIEILVMDIALSRRPCRLFLYKYRTISPISADTHTHKSLCIVEFRIDASCSPRCSPGTCRVRVHSLELAFIYALTHAFIYSNVCPTACLPVIGTVRVLQLIDTHCGCDSCAVTPYDLTILAKVRRYLVGGRWHFKVSLYRRRSYLHFDCTPLCRTWSRINYAMFVLC